MKKKVMITSAAIAAFVLSVIGFYKTNFYDVDFPSDDLMLIENSFCRPIEMILQSI